MPAYGILLSCEHGGNSVPPVYSHLFEGQAEVLQSHRGWDSGTLELGRYLAAVLALPLVYSTTTRLLIEMNRSLDHTQLFSEFSSSLPESEKVKLINRYYLPYRKSVRKEIERCHCSGQTCLHFSLHSFTPFWQSKERQMDIGLLFDPDRKTEKDLCALVRKILQQKLPAIRVVFNEPYFGTDDGLTTYLRTQYCDTLYAGIEIEINQKWVHKPVFTMIRDSLKEVLLLLKC